MNCVYANFHQTSHDQSLAIESPYQHNPDSCCCYYWLAMVKWQFLPSYQQHNPNIWNKGSTKGRRPDCAIPKAAPSKLVCVWGIVWPNLWLLTNNIRHARRLLPNTQPNHPRPRVVHTLESCVCAFAYVEASQSDPSSAVAHSSSLYLHSCSYRVWNSSIHCKGCRLIAGTLVLQSQYKINIHHARQSEQPIRFAEKSNSA